MGRLDNNETQALWELVDPYSELLQYLYQISPTCIRHDIHVVHVHAHDKKISMPRLPPVDGLPEACGEWCVRRVLSPNRHALLVGRFTRRTLLLVGTELRHYSGYSWELVHGDWNLGSSRMRVTTLRLRQPSQTTGK